MRRHRQAETVCAVDVIRGIVTAKRQATTYRGVAPAPTPVPSGIACGWALRVDLLPCGIGATPVLHPFPDIAHHVVQAPGVRLELPDGMCGTLVILVIPRILIQERIILPKIVLCRCPGPRRVFPFLFAR